MIQNQRQYNVTKGQIAKLEGALEASRGAAGRMDPRIYEAMIAGIESQIEELRQQLVAYEELVQAASLHLGSAEEIGPILIKARVARGMTQKDLAEAIKIQPQQIQKYEATEYRSASLKRVLEIMRALDVDIQADVLLTCPRAAAEPTKTRARGGRAKRRRAAGGRAGVSSRVAAKGKDRS